MADLIKINSNEIQKILSDTHKRFENCSSYLRHCSRGDVEHKLVDVRDRTNNHIIQIEYRLNEYYDMFVYDQKE